MIMNIKVKLEEAKRIEEKKGRKAVFGSRNGITKKGSREERKYFEGSY
jgi:hypothetical protein